MEEQKKKEKIESKEKLTQQQKQGTRPPKVKSKISVIIIAILVLVILIAIGIAIWKVFFPKKTDLDYQDTMEAYGFESLYNNGTSGESDLVTKSEAIKIIIGATLNTDSVANQVELRSFLENYDDTNEDVASFLVYPNQIWVEYAKTMGIIEDNVITKENENKTATLLEALVTLSKAKTVLLGKVLDTATNLNIKNMEALKVTEQLAIHDMVSNGIIENKEYNWKGNLNKKEFNQLVIDFANKYNTITVGDEKVNINQDKVPANASEFPYTLASVDKSTYEIPSYVVNQEKYQNAKRSYRDMKSYYYDINQLIETYANVVFNVDYQTINTDTFTKQIQELYFHRENEADIKAYVDYVKSNQIKMNGSVKVQYPAIYFDGEQYRVRVKVSYQIESAKEKKNLWYLDLQSKNAFTVDKTEDTMILDIPVAKAITSNAVYMGSSPILNCVAGNVTRFEREVTITDGGNGAGNVTNGSDVVGNTVPVDPNTMITF